jgi:phosphatidylglycerophosphate synthase
MRDEFELDVPEIEHRRPLKTRSWRVFQTLASKLASAGVSPNSISVLSVIFAAFGAAGFLITGWTADEIAMRIGWLIAIMGMQMRLIANLLDGMVAIEGGRASATGPLYNEVPDRLSDPILLVAAGYAYSGEPVAGWAAALLALLVAYVRAIAASVGAGQLFQGPMAKQQRMAVLTFIAALGLLLPSRWLQIFVTENRTIGLVELALWIIVIGCVITVVRRLRAAAAHLEPIRKPCTSQPVA